MRAGITGLYLLASLLAVNAGLLKSGQGQGYNSDQLDEYDEDKLIPDQNLLKNEFDHQVQRMVQRAASTPDPYKSGEGNFYNSLYTIQVTSLHPNQERIWGKKGGVSVATEIYGFKKLAGRKLTMTWNSSRPANEAPVAEKDPRDFHLNKGASPIPWSKMYKGGSIKEAYRPNAIMQAVASQFADKYAPSGYFEANITYQQASRSVGSYLGISDPPVVVVSCSWQNPALLFVKSGVHIKVTLTLGKNEWGQPTIVKFPQDSRYRKTSQ